jgi:hypothetical protein
MIPSGVKVLRASDQASDLAPDLAGLPTIQRIVGLTALTYSISRSNVRSATIFFNRLFSSSSGFSRFISVGSRPAYFFFQLK